ncbi:MAG TPA: SCO family protein [Polyangia bacterium]|nr:SCO family protein [Polyangia bacterium]
MKRPALAAGTLVLASLLARAAVAGDKSDKVVFPQGSEQPLAALQDIDVVEHLGDRVPAGLSFRDSGGHLVAFDDLLHQGRPLVVTLGYYRCPMLCGLVLDGLAKALKTGGLKLAKDYTAVSISIDPAEEPKLADDTQKRILAQMGEIGKTGKTGETGAPPHPEEWPFLLSSGTLGGSPNPPAKDSAGASPAPSTRMGGPENSRLLARTVGFRYKYDEQSRQFAHSAVAFVLTPDGVISRYLYGVDFLARDVRLALVEASGGRVGTSFDKVLLSCYRYDPVNRKYAPFVFAFVRVGAALVFFALAGLLTVLWRKELQMKRQRQRLASNDAKALWSQEAHR